MQEAGADSGSRSRRRPLPAPPSESLRRGLDRLIRILRLFFQNGIPQLDQLIGKRDKKFAIEVICMAQKTEVRFLVIRQHSATRTA